MQESFEIKARMPTYLFDLMTINNRALKSELNEASAMVLGIVHAE